MDGAVRSIRLIVYNVSYSAFIQYEARGGDLEPTATPFRTPYIRRIRVVPVDEFNMFGCDRAVGV